jgi:hypothetical protein
VLFVLLLGTASATAHDIPADTTVRAFVKPDGQRLRFLVRVQMASINDVDWPEGGRHADMARALDPFLRDAATMWISDYPRCSVGGSRRRR